MSLLLLLNGSGSPAEDGFYVVSGRATPDARYEGIPSHGATTSDVLEVLSGAGYTVWTLLERAMSSRRRLRAPAWGGSDHSDHR